ncbi:hypothetical protein Q8A67_023776 [Cirrhinus molitorella]|uniref:Uncharacterized protein n=1 Tax=Cirrhinus molitorella TaxID=172907 RepID=A0AA88P433_9TELE|nr:hypothetical protein Q8A67_023776 [Cirrhinus molitorella]
MGCAVLGCGGREDRGDHRSGGGAHLLAMIAVPHRTRLLLGHESQRPYGENGGLVNPSASKSELTMITSVRAMQHRPDVRPHAVGQSAYDKREGNDRWMETQRPEKEGKRKEEKELPPTRQSLSLHSSEFNIWPLQQYIWTASVLTAVS